MERIRLVLDLVTSDRCQVNVLVGYFGEERTSPCGHCTHCRTGVAQRLLPTAARPPIEPQVDRAALEALVAEHPGALGEPRQRARFLCGITSPATGKAKLGRHRAFGACEAWPFADVLAWTSGQAG